MPEIKAGDLGRGREAEGDAHRRHARRARAASPFVPTEVPRARALLRHRAEEPRRRGQDQQLAAAAPGGGPDDPLEPRPADQGAAALRPGPAAHRGDGREDEAAVRRRGEPEAAADPLPGDDHRGHRGAGTAQEADRRPRPVRRLQRSRWSRCRAEPTSSSSTTSSAGRSRSSSGPAVEKGIQETRLRGYLAGYPVVDFKVTLLDGKYHDVDSNELSFKMAGRLAFKDAHDALPADDPRADHERRGLRAVGLRRRPHGRPQQPAGADLAAWTPAAR